ncbi:hypothetical protein ACHAXS_004410, partial [Conticribra weissflogii]
GLLSINGDYHAGKLSDGVWDRDTYTLTMTKLTEVTPIFKSQSYFDNKVKMYEAQFSLKGETKSVGSTTNILLDNYKAIKALPCLKPHLQNALFTSRLTINEKQPTSKARPTSVPADIWSSLQRSHNSYHSSAPYPISLLIQGPPGTGKSSTIVGLVTALLSGKAPLPGQRQLGCLIHAGKSMGVSLSEPQARNRIQVCATTNQAVDTTLAWKIRQGSLGPSGKVGDFAMARFGSLPWEVSRGALGQKPENLSEMEEFLYEINVDRKASDAAQGFSNACQVSEPESLIPFKYNPTTITSVGDPQQLPVLTLSGSSYDNEIFEKSFIRTIAEVELANDNATSSVSHARRHRGLSIRAILLFQVDYAEKHPKPHCTVVAASLLSHYCISGMSTESMFRTVPSEMDLINQYLLVLFLFYKDQHLKVKLLRGELKKIPALNTSRVNVKIATVDGKLYDILFRSQ